MDGEMEGLWVADGAGSRDPFSWIVMLRRLDRLSGSAPVGVPDWAAVGKARLKRPKSRVVGFMFGFGAG